MNGFADPSDDRSYYAEEELEELLATEEIDLYEELAKGVEYVANMKRI